LDVEPIDAPAWLELPTVGKGAAPSFGDVIPAVQRDQTVTSLAGFHATRSEQRADELGPRAAWFEADVTDTDAFTAMRHLAGIRTLAVGVRSSEVAPQAFADCDLLVDGVDGVKALLRDLLALG